MADDDQSVMKFSSYLEVPVAVMVRIRRGRHSGQISAGSGLSFLRFWKASQIWLLSITTAPAWMLPRHGAVKGEELSVWINWEPF